LTQTVENSAFGEKNGVRRLVELDGRFGDGASFEACRDEGVPGCPMKLVAVMIRSQQRKAPLWVV